MRKEYKIGLFAIIVIVGSIWLFNFLKGKNLFTNNNIFYIEYKDAAMLGNSDPILINGYQIGTVIGMSLKPDLETILVQVEIDKDINLPKDALATIVTTGLTGDKAIQMQFYKPCSGDGCLQSGDYITGRTAGFVESMIGVNDIKGSVDELKGGMAGLLDTLSLTLSDESNENAIGQVFKSISATSANLDRATLLLESTLRGNQNNINQMMNNLASVSEALGKQSTAIEGIISNTEQFTSKLNTYDLDGAINQTKSTMKAGEDAVANLSKTLEGTILTVRELNKTLANINKGEGSVGKLLKDEALYNNLESATKNLDALLIDMKENPKDYVNFSLFGGKKKKKEDQ